MDLKKIIVFSSLSINEIQLIFNETI